jgi:hypothetical protein
VAAFIRIKHADLYSYSPDEINHIEMAKGHSLSEVLRFSLTETHPPLGNVLRHYWIMISDTPEFMRSLSLLFGLALIPLYYLIGTHLGGRWAGLSSATLAAFSSGSIIQSYVVRNYSIFLFLLSLGVYVYLLWRENRRFSLLLAYICLGCLAVLTHFSGLFAIFCIAATESLCLLYARAPWRTLVQWIIANLCIASVGLAVMHIWQPLLSYTRLEMSRLMHDLYVMQGPLYPLLAIDYLFFYRTDAFYSVLLFTLVMASIGISAWRIPAIRFYALLAGVSLLLGWGLAISEIYPAGGNRYSLWLLPFLVPSVACGLGFLLQRFKPLLPNWAIGTMLFLCATATYDEQARFDDKYEYMIHPKELSDFKNYLKALDASHLIIAGRSDAFLINYPNEQNLYRFYTMPRNDEQGNFTEGMLTALLPFSHAQLLFKPYAYHYTAEDLIAIVADANAKKLLEGINTLVFTSTRWSRKTTLDLVLCANLDKTVLTFPKEWKDHSLTKQELFDYDFPIVLEISKQDFLNELAARNGKARSCLVAN